MRKPLFIGSVFVALGACAAVACSGFSSSETIDPNDASVADAPSVAVDAMSLDGDSSAQGEDAAAASDAGVADSGRQFRVFVTSALYGGLEVKEGSARCQDLADAVKLGGSWAAWISKSASQDARAVIQGGPWWKIDRSAIALSVIPLVDGGLAYQPAMSINWTEDGGVPLGPVEVWTGTFENGATAGNGEGSCAYWSAILPGADGVVGLRNASSLPAWTNAGKMSCSTALHLYCFEVP